MSATYAGSCDPVLCGLEDGMQDVQRPRSQLRAGCVGCASDDRTARGRHGFLFIVGGWLVVGLGHVIVAVSDDPASGGTLFWSASLVAAALVSIAVGAAIFCAAALSSKRYVFHSRPAFGTAIVLLVVTAGAMTYAIRSTSFGDVASYGKPLSGLIVELGTFAGAIICFAVGVIALRRASDALRDERGWGDTRQS